MQNPIRGFLHGSAAIAAVFGLVWLLIAADGGWSRHAALAVFGAALIMLYVISTLYHTIPWNHVWKKRMQRVDHSSIFIFIAASYVPLAVIVLDGWLKWGTLAVVWSITLLGIGQLVFFPRESTGISIAMNTVLGLLAVLLVQPVVDRLGWTAAGLLALGGIFYIVGMVFVVTNWPKLWPRTFGYHEAFHVLVILGTASHFAVAVAWVAPYQVV